jgi:hypothetical protein
MADEPADVLGERGLKRRLYLLGESRDQGRTDPYRAQDGGARRHLIARQLVRASEIEIDFRAFAKVQGAAIERERVAGPALQQPHGAGEDQRSRIARKIVRKICGGLRRQRCHRVQRRRLARRRVAFGDEGAEKRARPIETALRAVSIKFRNESRNQRGL